MSDLISRQAAIDAIIADKIEGNALNIIIALGDGKQAETLNEACDRHAQLLNDLPFAQPERTGKWIKLDAHAHLADHKCSACGQECYVPTCMGDPMYDFCPNCGCRMLKKGEEHETD